MEYKQTNRPNRQTDKTKINEQTKLDPKNKKAHRHRDQRSGDQEGRDEGEGKSGRGSQLFGDGWKLNFW